jgi:protein-disulfide isomerase
VALSNGAANVVAALIIGGSIVAGSFLVQSSVEKTARQISALEDAIENAGVAPARGARPERLDPNRRYSVNTQGAPVRGSPDAKLAIVEFSDFQCPFCARVNPTLLQILGEYDGKVRIVFKHMPLSIHPKAPAAHAAAEAAHRQGKFWEMHDKIFADQRSMSPEKYLEYAQQLGLDMEAFRRDVADNAIQKRIDADAAEAARLAVGGTPGFFVNGRFLNGAVPFTAFQELINEELGRS